ncbi:MAG: hypothetical protein LUE25_01100 [Clostridiales bacterium]|nr:hypothetical protein [Clostridia bacterium]MCD8055307.1 hypothetical protein [Clostridiales bacterium]
MTESANIIKNRISELCTHVTFEYNGKLCGVDPYNENSFELWYGDNLIEVTNIDDVMQIPFFESKSLLEIADEIVNLDLG